MTKKEFERIHSLDQGFNHNNNECILIQNKENNAQ